MQPDPREPPAPLPALPPGVGGGVVTDVGDHGLTGLGQSKVRGQAS